MLTSREYPIYKKDGRHDVFYDLSDGSLEGIGLPVILHRNWYLMLPMLFGLTLTAIKESTLINQVPLDEVVSRKIEALSDK